MLPRTEDAETPKAHGGLSPDNAPSPFLVTASGKFSLEYTTLPATLINSTAKNWDQICSVILTQHLIKATTSRTLQAVE